VENIHQDFIRDLNEATETTLLIEVYKRHVEAMRRHNEAFDEYAVCRDVFDEKLTDRQTNVIRVDAKADQPNQLMSQIYALVGADLKQRASIDAALKLAIHVSTMGLSELVNSSISDAISNTVNELVDGIGSKITDFISSRAEAELVNAAGDKSLEAIEGTDATNVKGMELFLSHDARKQLLELASSAPDVSTPHEAMQYIVKLIEVLGIGAPKLIVINDPFSLDVASLALCSLMLSHAKDKKLQGETFPVSIVFNYTHHQPFDKTDDASKQGSLIIRLRHMVQRYGMLEKPGTNIPTPAVNSSVFVGRHDELASLSQRHHAYMESVINRSDIAHHWELISGEPGAGKTALANQHISRLSDYDDKKDTAQIRLRLLNQIGHQSQNTGLASLLQSIQREALRLTEYYDAHNSFLYKVVKNKIDEFRDVGDNIKEIFTKGSVSSDNVHALAKSIASATHYGTLFDAAKSAKNRLSMDRYANAIGESIKKENKSEKEQQFERLLAALSKLKRLTREIHPDAKTMPIMLVIDDIQWIDELTAEFITEWLMPRYSIEFVGTCRQADAALLRKKTSDQHETRPFTRALLSLFGLTEDDVSTTCYETNIKGMARGTLTSLIEAVFSNPDKRDVSPISSALIAQLNERDNEHVNTLFAIETLNLLSDKGFYQDKDVTPLFIETTRGQYSINNIPASAFQSCIDTVFGQLKDAYNDAFAQDEMKQDANIGFTLSSYAVMEERLHILMQYLGDFGDIANFTLQIASMISAPFSSQLVDDVIAHLRGLDETAHPELAPLINMLKKQPERHLSTEHYQILEEVLEIVKRVRNEDMHTFTHNLYTTFLRQSCLNVLKDTLGTSDKKIIGECIAVIAQYLHQQIENIELTHDATTRTYQKTIYLTKSLSALLQFAHDTFGMFIHERIHITYGLAVILGNMNRYSESLEVFDEVEKLCNVLESSDEKQENVAMIFGEEFNLEQASIDITEGKMDVCHFLGRHEDVKALYQRARNMVENNTQLSVDEKDSRIIGLLNTLGNSYNKQIQVNHAIAVQKEAMEMAEKLYQRDPEIHQDIYVKTLFGMAKGHLAGLNYQAAAPFALQAFEQTKQLADANRSAWLGGFVNAAILYASICSKTGENAQSIDVLTQLLPITDGLQQRNPDIWLEDHAWVVHTLTMSYLLAGAMPSAKQVIESVMPLLESEKEKSAELPGHYLNVKAMHMTCLLGTGDKEGAVRVAESLISLTREEQLAGRSDIASTVNTLLSCASAFLRYKMFEKSEMLIDELITMLDEQEEIESYHAYMKLQSFALLANTLLEKGEIDNAVSIVKKDIIPSLDVTFSMLKGVEMEYVSVLSASGKVLRKNNDIEQSEHLLLKALNIIEKEGDVFEVSTLTAQTYFQIAKLYRITKDMLRAEKFAEKALSNCDDILLMNSAAFDSHHTALSLLRDIYCQTGRTEEAITLYQRYTDTYFAYFAKAPVEHARKVEDFFVKLGNMQHLMKDEKGAQHNNLTVCFNKYWGLQLTETKEGIPECVNAVFGLLQAIYDRSDDKLFWSLAVKHIRKLTALSTEIWAGHLVGASFSHANLYVEDDREEMIKTLYELVKDMEKFALDEREDTKDKFKMALFLVVNEMDFDDDLDEAQRLAERYLDINDNAFNEQYADVMMMLVRISYNQHRIEKTDTLAGILESELHEHQELEWVPAQHAMLYMLWTNLLDDQDRNNEAAVKIKKADQIIEKHGLHDYRSGTDLWDDYL